MNDLSFMEKLISFNSKLQVAVFFEENDQVTVKTGKGLLTVGMVFIIQGMAFDGLKHGENNHLDRL